MLINNNIYQMAGGGKMITQRYADYFVERKEDKRSAKEIVQDTMKKAGLRFAEVIDE